ncbi:hypothetical protein DMN91_004821 [Ooceraea biroi]|uniref:Uncharacterized protein n=1 Tax=Ooceraea biroi TaxID=2015173 RepID=A0A3L8DQT2_OOCBI|nr:hypothetical protein DMN91_004821 [Ooceraea biroi]
MAEDADALAQCSSNRRAYGERARARTRSVSPPRGRQNASSLTFADDTHRPVSPRRFIRMCRSRLKRAGGTDSPRQQKRRSRRFQRRTFTSGLSERTTNRPTGRGIRVDEGIKGGKAHGKEM